MILNTTPQNEAVISNVQETGEFRIRNSAKAFSILSSGLYANKIRAIVRELSTNAYDSHVAAGKAATPFDVHLPNSLEPWFSIRDYGTGLSHDQVRNIYTTYFESTKTGSNDFVGALGLGSKSPFSYTDNFTVTAIKDGKRGIYTAFINEQGVPSIALMLEEDSDEPTGVEVKFSVNDTYDFNKFRHEAESVYAYFEHCPNVTGSSQFRVNEIRYIEKDIIPGVSTTNRSSSSVAVMGNISYPIDVPNADTNLQGLQRLLQCGLELRFNIGELDFQASREGLSYIPQTIEAIRNKLAALNAKLAEYIANEAKKIKCVWQRTQFLETKGQEYLWKEAVALYVKSSKFPLIDASGYYIQAKPFSFTLKALADKYNVSFNVIDFYYNNRYREFSSNRPSSDYDVGTSGYIKSWKMYPNKDIHFIVNDLKTGAVSRVKHYYKNNGTKNVQLVIIDAAIAGTEMKIKKLFKDLMNPPTVKKASEFEKVPRTANGVTRSKNVGVLYLSKSGYGRSYKDGYTWSEVVNGADSLSDTDPIYYVPISGFALQSKYQVSDAKWLADRMHTSGVSQLANLRVYGVRKSDLAEIQKRANWFNLEDYIAEVLNDIDDSIAAQCALDQIDYKLKTLVNLNLEPNITDPNSPFLALSETLRGKKAAGGVSLGYLTELSAKYAPGSKITAKAVAAKIEELVNEAHSLYNHYPMLGLITSSVSSVDQSVFYNYINAMDELAAKTALLNP